MDQQQFDIMLADAETRLDRLKALYEQWFQGFEKLEPTVLRKNLDRLLDNMRRDMPRNVGLRFRYQQLVQRYTTYMVYWKRIARQIEEGTYNRDILRARRRRLEAAAEQRERLLAEAGETGLTEAQGREAVRQEELDELRRDSKIDAILRSTYEEAGSKSQPPPQTPKARKSIRPISPFAMPSDSASERLPTASGPPAAAEAGETAGGGDISEQRIREIYGNYLEVRRQNNERTDNVKLESLAKSVLDMLPKLKQKYPGRSIDFEVIVKDGRTALKPMVK